MEIDERRRWRERSLIPTGQRKGVEDGMRLTGSTIPYGEGSLLDFRAVGSMVVLNTAFG